MVKLKDKVRMRLQELTVRRPTSPAQSVFSRFFRMFVRLNRFYNSLYEKAKPSWMRKGKRGMRE